LEAQAQRVPGARRPRDVQPGSDDTRLHDVALAGELERIDADAQIEPAPFAGREPQAPQIECVSTQGHAHEINRCPRQAGAGSQRSSRLRILPVALRGSRSTKTISRGTL